MRLFEDRILFLREFTKELILNSPRPVVKHSETEQFQEIFQPVKIRLNAVEKPKFIPSQPIGIPMINQQMPSISSLHSRPLLVNAIEAQPIKEKLTMELNEPPMIQPPNRIIQNFNQKVQFPNEPQILPQPTNLPSNFEAGKINFLISDPRVTIIECPGPNKLVIAKMYGKSTVTKLALTQEEISSIIDNFSKTSKIPVISGLFKAAVGNLIITAVVSDLVGSRFIITKITPAFVLEQNPPVAPTNMPF